MESNAVALVLTSSLLSALITSTINWLLQRTNYKHDYYKKILEKRLQTYESVEKIIDRLSLFTQLEDGSVFHSIFFSAEYHLDFLMLTSLGTNTLWLSNELGDKLTEFSIFLLQEIGNEVQGIPKEEVDEKHISIGIQIAPQVREFKNDIKLIFHQDITELHDVKAFLKRKKEKERLIHPVYKHEDYKRRKSG